MLTLLIPKITYKEAETMNHDMPRSRCWLEVDTGVVLNNLNVIRSLLKPNTDLIAVLKADAYGLGAGPVARLLNKNGVCRFSVACLEEAFQLRDVIPDAWILCMGETLDGALEDAVEAGIRLTVGSFESAARISRAAQRIGRQAFVHFKVDTGLHRIGLKPEEAAKTILRCIDLPLIQAEGIYTHLALHNTNGDIKQHAEMQIVLQALEEAGYRPSMVHMLDSIGLTRYPDWQYQAVRVGAMLYGNAPKTFDRINEMKSTVRFVARVSRVERVQAGECIGYDDHNPLKQDSTIATLTVGYVDGYPRVMSDCGSVEIHGKRAKNIGLICMDQMMVDVTDIADVKPGDEAVLLGGGISLYEYADVGHMNRNEVTAIIGKRVPRIYI